MDVKDRLPGTSVAVKQRAVALFRVTELLGNKPGPPNHFTDEPVVLYRQIVEGRDMFSRNDKDMGWRLGISVLEGYQTFILIDDAGWNLTIGDLTEEAVSHHLTSSF